MAQNEIPLPPLPNDDWLDTPPPSYVSYDGMPKDVHLEGSEQPPSLLWDDDHFDTEMAAYEQRMAAQHSEKRRGIFRKAAALTGVVALGGAAYLGIGMRGGEQKDEPRAVAESAQDASVDLSVEDERVEEAPKATSLLERKYEQAEVLQQSTPFAFSGADLLENPPTTPMFGQFDQLTPAEQDRQVDQAMEAAVVKSEIETATKAIELNKAEFITAVQLSSGMKINFYQAHITELPQEPIEIDGQAVELLLNHALEFAAQLSGDNPYAAGMKALKLRAERGELGDATVTVIISADGECVSDKQPEILDDDKGLKGTCLVADGENEAVAMQYNAEAVRVHSNPTILLSNVLAQDTKGSYGSLSEEDVQYLDQDPKFIVMNDALSSAFVHEFGHAFRSIGNIEYRGSDAEHDQLVDPMHEEIRRLFVATPGEQQVGENRYISPIYVNRSHK